ncbi:TrkH family potassium uptake protein [Maribacter sp. Asnod1-A12]|uniref:TrkH family potassium uptake protein n=1 Tax=Maribacter sp. Asnod1-A12 TaxID=3160576 RepID=UPI00386656FC
MGFIKNSRNTYIKFKLGLSPQQTLFYGFLTYITVGFLVLSIPFLQHKPVAWIDNLFTAASAVSTTGLLTVPLTDSYNFFGQLVILILIQLGGIGYLTFTTFVILSTTRKMTHWHQKILQTEFTLPNTLKIKDFLKSVVLFTLIMETIGIIMYFFAFKEVGFTFWNAIWSAIFHSVSAFCTAGFSLDPNGFTAYLDNGLINATTSILAISGSLGFIVVTDLYLYLRNKDHSLSFTTKIIIYGFICLLTLGTLLLYFTEPTLSTLESKERFMVSFFQSMSAMTTVGFNTIDFGLFSQAVLLITIFLMYVGASPSGTAGGIKITTLTAILAIMKSGLQGNKTVTFLRKRIPKDRLQIATSTFIFYTLLLILGTLLVSYTNDFKFEDILFEVASALGTVGLSTGITADLDSFGKIILSLLMFIGRLGALTFGLAIWYKSKKNVKIINEEDLAL